MVIFIHLLDKHIIQNLCSKAWYSFLKLNHYITHFCFNHKELFVSQHPLLFYASVFLLMLIPPQGLPFLPFLFGKDN